MPSSDKCQTLTSVLDTLWEGVFITDRNGRLRFWSRGAERLTGYTAEEVASGPSCEEFLLGPDEDGAAGPKRPRPVALTLVDGTPHEVSAVVRHKGAEGFPARIRTSTLRSSDGKVTGVIASFTATPTVTWALARIAELQQLAYLDPLTGVANRRFVEYQIQSSLGQLARFGWGFGIVLLDLDRFKRVNDDHGHTFGDGVLKLVARSLARHTRVSDLFGRWGGDEFLAVVKNADRAQLEIFARKLASAVRGLPFALAGERLGITASTGVCEAARGDTVETLVARADRVLYGNKETGRRRSVPEYGPFELGELVGQRQG